MAQSAEQLSEEAEMQQKFGTNRTEVSDAEVQNGEDSTLTAENATEDNQTAAVNNNNNVTPRVYSNESEELKSSKMTSSATQTVDLFNAAASDGQLHLPQDEDDEDVANLASMYHGTWPMDKVLWQSGPGSLGGNGSLSNFYTQDTASVMSFRSNVGSTSSQRRSLSQQLGTKVEMVYSLLSMLGSHDKDDMSKTLFSMSKSQESCVAMRQSGCLPLLVDLIHTNAKDVASVDSNRPSRETRLMASQTLHNIVHSHPDDKRGRREARVLRLLEQIREYCDSIHDSDSGSEEEDQRPNCEQHPVPTMAMLMKLSFDEEHRHAMCQLGGLQAIAELIQADYTMHGNVNDHDCITLRRYAGMALTNLTFGDGTNKALLCSMRSFMKALVAQLHSPSEDLRQVVASVLRNLSWRADQASKLTLQEVGAVVILTKAAIEATKESTLKSILSALWNLSAHCSTNKAGICAVDGALAFLVETLTYKSPSKTLAIVENGGGILRNISSHISVREDYRQILRQHHCLQILLQHLRSPSLTIVSNACGTLWNLSARCPKDQQALWEMNAVNMLRNLVHSKHKMISMGSSAALKNLLAAKPDGAAAAVAAAADSGMPCLLVRKQRALEAELDPNLAETCENLDSPKSSPTHVAQRVDPGLHGRGSTLMAALHTRMHNSVSGQMNLADPMSGSCLSDTSHDRRLPGSWQEMLIQNTIAAAAAAKKSEIPIPMVRVKNGGTVTAAKVIQVMKDECGEMLPPQAATKEKESDAKETKVEPRKKEEKLAASKRRPKSSGGGPDDASPEGPRGKGATGIPRPISALSAPERYSYDKYTDLTTKVSNLNLNDEDSPYPAKYSEETKSALSKTAVEKAVQPRNNNFLLDTKVEDVPVMAAAPYLKKLKGGTMRKMEGSEYGHYAETDLDDPDQPTNYSLRYTEDTDTTDHFKPPAPNDEVPPFYTFGVNEPSVHDDTLMTYCTEGTPLNFSTATSMTDLREGGNNCKADGKRHEAAAITVAVVKPTAVTAKVTRESVAGQAEKVEKKVVEKEEQVVAETAAVPAKIAEVVESPAQREDAVRAVKPGALRNQQTGEPKVHDKEVKSVTFGEENYTEETPLMFSRCSSLGSLSSFDQHSIHDERSSVISDFSRRASEVVSPSDLPDSPSETMPPRPGKPTPKDSERPLDPVAPTLAEPAQQAQLPVLNGSGLKDPVDDESVFEEVPQLYLEEGTPLRFSTATSLSSLAIDEHSDETSAPVRDDGPEASFEDNNGHGFADPETDDSPGSASGNVSDDEGNEEDLLAECINSGMPNNTRQHKQKHNNSKLMSRVNVLNTEGPRVPLRTASNIPVKVTNVMVHRPIPSTAAAANFEPSHEKPNNTDKKVNNNSFSRHPPENSSDSGSAFDDENEHILDECIISAMPRSKTNEAKGSRVFSVPDGQEEGPGSKKKAVIVKPVTVPKRANEGTWGWDTMRTYACEGTPGNFSANSSLSGGFKDSRNCWQPEIHPRMTPADGCSAEDSPKMFLMEGTPASFSRNDSLSSLSCDGTEFSGLDNGNHRVSPPKCEGKRENVEPFFLTDTEETPRRFATEDTPAIFSPNSSVSSVSADADPTTQSAQPMAAAPGSFSRNSSLSSLSVESLGVEPMDQALLEQCINEAMPKKVEGANAVEDPLNKVWPKNLPGSAARCAADATAETKDLRGEGEGGKGRDDLLLSVSMMGGLGTRRPSTEAEIKMSGSLDQIHLAKKVLNSSGPRGPVAKSAVPELVLRALGTQSCKQTTASMDNVSMKSSMTGSEVLENVKPPSCMDDIDLTSSTYSICSIASEVEEPRSDIPSMKESVDSELMSACVRPAAIMAELYCREVAATANTLKSSVSECIDNINPPSIFQDVTEVTGTFNDTTKVPSTDSPSPDCDTDIEDDLPEDGEPVPTGDQGTLKHKSSRRALSPDRCGEGDLSISPEVVQALQDNANLVLSTLEESRDRFMMADDTEMIECETVSLVSNDDSEESSAEEDEEVDDDNEEEPSGASPVPKGPRIVKPIIRDAIRRLSLQKDTGEETPKGIRGRRKALYARSSSTPSSASPAARSLSPKVKDIVVKPTRTSALRANQSLQKTVTPPTVTNSSPPPCVKTVTPRKAVRGRGFIVRRNNEEADKESQDEGKRPKPPNKQGTFTKEGPTQDQIPKISPSKTRIPSFAAPQQSKTVKDGPGSVNRSRGHSVTDGVQTRYQRSMSINSDQQTKMTAPSKRLGSGFLVNNRSRAGTLKSAKRSSSNASLCSSASDSTTTSRKSSTGASCGNKRDVVSKVATIWKKDGGGRNRSGGGSSGGEGSSGSENNNRISTVTSGKEKSRKSGIPRSATYEKMQPEEWRDDSKKPHLNGHGDDGTGKCHQGSVGPTAAIVQPFNYNPNAVRAPQPRSMIPTPTKMVVPSQRHIQRGKERSFGDGEGMGEDSPTSCVITAA